MNEQLPLWDDIPMEDTDTCGCSGARHDEAQMAERYAATAAFKPLPQTAFVVVVDSFGDANAYGDLTQIPKCLQREATVSDIRRACSEVVTEINLQATAKMSAFLSSQTINKSHANEIRGALARRGINIH